MDGVSEVRESREGRRRGREGNEKEGNQRTDRDLSKIVEEWNSS